MTPYKKCPQCHTKLHIRLWACSCGYTFAIKRSKPVSPQKLSKKTEMRFIKERLCLSYTEDSALLCFHCIGCTSCIGCIGCTSCIGCIGCMGCTSCIGCMGCTSCIGCIGCSYWLYGLYWLYCLYCLFIFQVLIATWKLFHLVLHVHVHSERQFITSHFPGIIMPL